VALASILFLAFLFGFATPRRRREWRNAGLTSAFFIILSFNIQWPTLLTLLVALVLVVMYIRPPRQEDRDLEAEFGDTYRAYARGTNAFIPGKWQRKAIRELT